MAPWGRCSMNSKPAVQAKLLPARTDTYWRRAQDAQIRSWQSRIAGGLSACIMPVETARRVGFDPAIWIAGDDMDFLYRFRKAGHKAGLSAVSVIHEHRISFKGLVKQKFWYGRAKPALIKKHGPWHPDLWAPAVMAYWIGVSVVRGRLTLVPYFLISGFADTAGMIRGIFEINQPASRSPKRG
jgi:GT2 family glycosyltransferase